MKKCYFDIPTQVAFYDADGDHYVGGIAYQEHIICGCCGGLMSIEEIYEAAPEGMEAIHIYSTWTNLSDEICGGELPTTQSRVDRLTSYLLGTCKSFSEGCEDLGIDEDSLTEEELAEFDEVIFCCDGCGWWEEICDKHDLGGDALCSDCLEDEVHQD